MGRYRARKDLVVTDQRGNEREVEKGELVKIINRHVANRLVSEGKLVPESWSASSDYKAFPMAAARKPTLRVAIWLRTSTHYSGGRLHMYQYALALAQNGAEVWLVTDKFPKWAHDYPDCERLYIAVGEDARVPRDLDIIVTDSKGKYGQLALDARKQNEGARLVTMNFETPNWVSKYCPEYARALNAEQWRAAFQEADLQLANSKHSLEYCLEWLNQPDKRSAVLPPALNAHALRQAESPDCEADIPDRPYAVWSARGASYKGSELTQESVWQLDREFDLVTLGRPHPVVQDNEKHELHQYPDASDRVKYELMAEADVVLAPSLFEGFGMVPMEALATGTPAVVYDLPVLRWAYGDRLEYVEWGQEEAFKQRVADLCEDDAPMSVGKETQQHIRTTYGHEAMKERVEALPYHHVKAPVVSAHMILWGYPTLAPHAIRSVYDFVDQLVIAHGSTPAAQGTWEDADSLSVIEDLPDPDGKIEIEARDAWAGKAEMRNWCVDRTEGNRMLMLDADEIWVNPEGMLEDGVKYGTPRWVNLWHSGGHWIYDGKENNGERWGYPLEHEHVDGKYGSVCPHYRWSWWRPCYRFEHHAVPRDPAGARLTGMKEDGFSVNRAAAEQAEDTIIYHLGHALPPDVMRQKHAFYEDRDGAPKARRRAWHQWNGETGKCPDGIVETVDWALPEAVSAALEDLHNERE